MKTRVCLKYFLNDCTFNGVFSRYFPRIKDGAYVRNLDDKQNKGTHWFLLTEIQLCTLILLGLNIFHKTY